MHFQASIQKPPLVRELLHLCSVFMVGGRGANEDAKGKLMVDVIEIEPEERHIFIEKLIKDIKNDCSVCNKYYTHMLVIHI